MVESIELYEVLVPKCDGMTKNKNVPKYIKQLLNEKYTSHHIMSINCNVQYDIDIFKLLVNYSLFCCHFTYILYSYHIHFIFILILAWNMCMA